MKKKLAAAMAAAILSVAGAPAALAHDSVIDADPGVDAIVTEFPTELVLVFSGIPRDGFNTIALSRMDTNEVLFSGEPTVDRQNVSIDVPEGLDPEPGQYRIGFQITSSDGHATKGMTQFTYQPPGTTVEAEASDEGEGKPDKAQQNADEPQDIIGGYIWVWILFGVVLVGGAVIALLGQRQRNGQGKTNRD
ncbi:copper resistance protein CopC [Corynebacterium sp. MSK041]|uniref:copper resistance CopC family protein n=1 Tax=Corynebacterium sp. MSK041 TaxID=3050194 RepID=UPI00254D81BF|nr:copper resistance CopC family protein [Corynebacterium sp. MSK041]MDK8794536.1 copper resistance protein CopC [Corynebacterium sp. MSK041]